MMPTKSVGGERDKFQGFCRETAESSYRGAVAKIAAVLVLWYD